MNKHVKYGKNMQKTWFNRESTFWGYIDLYTSEVRDRMGGEEKRREKRKKIKDKDLLVMSIPVFEIKFSNNCCNQDSFLKAKTVLCTTF